MVPTHLTRSPKFQSTPLAEARGDRFSTHSADCFVPSFNPLPSQKRGETPRSVFRWRASGTFQSTPLAEARGDFGISSPSLVWVFQSTPLAEARGDRP